MENITELIRNRRSVRTFDGREISAADKEKLFAFMSDIQNPYLMPVEFKMLDAKENGLNIAFSASNPEIPVKTNTEYIGSYLIEKYQCNKSIG